MYSAAQQGPLAGPEPEERVGRKRHIPLRELVQVSPRGPGCHTEGCRGPGAPRGLSQGRGTWAHSHIHTHTQVHASVCTQGTDALPHGLLTMVTEWPPLSSSHHLKVSEASCAGGSSSNKGTAQPAWPGVHGADQPAHACRAPPGELGATASSYPACLAPLSSTPHRRPSRANEKLPSWPHIKTHFLSL